MIIYLRVMLAKPETSFQRHPAVNKRSDFGFKNKPGEPASTIPLVNPDHFGPASIILRDGFTGTMQPKISPCALVVLDRGDAGDAHP